MRQVLRFLVLVMAMAFGLPAHAQAPAAVKVGMYINDIQSIDLHSYSFVADV